MEKEKNAVGTNLKEENRYLAIYKRNGKEVIVTAPTDRALSKLMEEAPGQPVWWGKKSATDAYISRSFLIKRSVYQRFMALCRANDVTCVSILRAAMDDFIDAHDGHDGEETQAAEDWNPDGTWAGTAEDLEKASCRF